MLSLRVADHVRYSSEDHGGVVILDTAAGLWMALNPTGGDFWRSWQSGAGLEEGVAEVAARYPDVPLESIRADGERLVEDLFFRGLIQVIPQSVPDGAPAVMAEPEAVAAGPRPGLIIVIMAAVCLLGADLLLRFSFRASFALVRATHRGWCRRVPTSEQAAITVAAVSRAARLHPFRAACLEQSLASVLMAAIYRRKLDWCVGSAPDPYRFHAWTEISGQPVPVPGEKLSQSGYKTILVA